MCTQSSPTQGVTILTMLCMSAVLRNETTQQLPLIMQLQVGFPADVMRDDIRHSRDGRDLVWS